MDGWPKIPQQPGGRSAVRPGGSSLPAPGSVVMASVEEDLGEGMYALRWAGQRIAVSSRIALKPGQSLILKSETSPEGKPRLVVQGPALPDTPKITGPVIYGPGSKTGRYAKTEERQAEGQSGRAAPSQSRPAESVPPGGQVAAGVVKINANSPAPPQSAQSLIGLVLEPLPEFKASVELLMEALREEKARLSAPGDTTRRTRDASDAGTEDGDGAEKPPDAAEKKAAEAPLVVRRETGGAEAALAARPAPPRGETIRPAPETPAEPPGRDAASANREVARPETASPSRSEPTSAPPAREESPAPAPRPAASASESEPPPPGRETPPVRPSEPSPAASPAPDSEPPHPPPADRAARPPTAPIRETAPPRQPARAQENSVQPAAPASTLQASAPGTRPAAPLPGVVVAEPPASTVPAENAPPRTAQEPPPSAQARPVETPPSSGTETPPSGKTPVENAPPAVSGDPQRPAPAVPLPAPAPPPSGPVPDAGPNARTILPETAGPAVPDVDAPDVSPERRPAEQPSGEKTRPPATDFRDAAPSVRPEAPPSPEASSRPAPVAPYPAPPSAAPSGGSPAGRPPLPETAVPTVPDVPDAPPEQRSSEQPSVDGKAENRPDSREPGAAAPADRGSPSSAPPDGAPSARPSFPGTAGQGAPEADAPRVPPDSPPAEPIPEGPPAAVPPRPRDDASVIPESRPPAGEPGTAGAAVTQRPAPPEATSPPPSAVPPDGAPSARPHPPETAETAIPGVGEPSDASPERRPDNRLPENSTPTATDSSDAEAGAPGERPISTVPAPKPETPAAAPPLPASPAPSPEANGIPVPPPTRQDSTPPSAPARENAAVVPDAPAYPARPIAGGSSAQGVGEAAPAAEAPLREDGVRIPAQPPPPTENNRLSANAAPPEAPPPEAALPPPAQSLPRPAETPGREHDRTRPGNDSVPVPSGRPASPPAAVEAPPREALAQMMDASELPLGAPESRESLGVGGKAPEAVVDKAAELFLRAAGLTPDETTMTAAKALIANNAQVDRETLQAMLTVAAAVEPERREDLFRAAARLAARDAPMAAPLVSGLADVMGRTAGAHELMERARQALDIPRPSAETAPLLAGARELLDMLHVDLERADAAQALERYVSSFGREALGKALALVEASAQAALETHPTLPIIDQALSAIIAELEAVPPASGLVDAGDATRTPETRPPPDAPRPAPAEEEGNAPKPAPTSPINAYLRSPRAVAVDELLKNLPPMPRPARLGDAAELPAPPPQSSPQPPPAQPANPAQSASPQAPSPRPAELPPAPVPQTPPSPSGELAGQSVLNKLDSLFQTPGLNRPELELLRPSGFLDRFFNSPPAGADPARIKAEAEALFRQLTQGNPEQAARALRDIGKKEPAVLRETAARLGRFEADIVKSDPLLARFSDAATSLRDLGRQMLAVKAENLAGQDRQPGVMLAEVPFKLNDDAGEGRMQMFYRRGKSGKGGWSSRVILDLNTTRMGPVLGDMRFFGQDMTVNVFVENRDTADYLERSAEDLAARLEEKGFRVKARFMVMPAGPSAPELRAERPQITGESAFMEEGGTSGTRRIGRLDIKG